MNQKIEEHKLQINNLKILKLLANVSQEQISGLCVCAISKHQNIGF